MKARIVNSGVAGGSDGAIMSNEDAELVIKTIYHRPDTRFASLGGVDSDIAKSNAIYKVVKSISDRTSIKNLEAFSTTVRTNSHRDVVRKTQTKEVDVTTGAVVRKMRVISGDATTNDEDDSNIIGGVASTDPMPAEKMDMRDLLTKIDILLMKLPKQKADAFRMVVKGYSYLEVARTVFNSTVKDTDSDSRKKIDQNRIACIVDRVRRKLISVCGAQACELGVLSKSRLRSHLM